MAQIKLTKTELRDQQYKLIQLNKYLPTLQLKKALLQAEVQLAQEEIETVEKEFKKQEQEVGEYALLFTDRNVYDLFSSVKIDEVSKTNENIAGIDIPKFDEVLFEESRYPLFDAPIWLDGAVAGLKKLISLREKKKIAEEKKRKLESELRSVSIRVNLFEKIMIPRAEQNIKKIKVFLGDQQLAAVCQAKVSKEKILARKEKIS